MIDHNFKPGNVVRVSNPGGIEGRGGEIFPIGTVFTVLRLNSKMPYLLILTNDRYTCDVGWNFDNFELVIQELDPQLSFNF